jgi:hypothetical protein
MNMDQLFDKKQTLWESILSRGVKTEDLKHDKEYQEILHIEEHIDYLIDRYYEKQTEYPV